MGEDGKKFYEIEKKYLFLVLFFAGREGDKWKCKFENYQVAPREIAGFLLYDSERTKREKVFLSNTASLDVIM
jgi:hypothetical protein